MMDKYVTEKRMVEILTENPEVTQVPCPDCDAVLGCVCNGIYCCPSCGQEWYVQLRMLQWRRREDIRNPRR